ncbi:SMP-30/gluconolactonase/LRE family protein [Actinocrispum sp. NPDC049592]|uniref:SMP-30/gluconolactonase/LRE family protein n=1 Tax=Actinocrispum sp. NPDC049592 TaxID=3154835 RepID=UPI003423D17A
MRRLLLLVLAGVMLVCGPAVAGRYPSAIAGHGPTLHPEGVTWDPSRQAFLIGSFQHGDISVVRPDGQTRTLVHDAQVTQTFGVHVDAIRNRILAATSTGVGIFDLRTGRTLHLATFGTSPNDLAIDWAGNAYVTDIHSATITRVDPQGRATPLVTDPRLGSPDIGANGIVWHPLGFLLVVNYSTGKLFRIATGTGRIDEVRLDRPLTGGDGLALRPDGSLIAVTNSFGGPGVDAVSVLDPVGRWSAATTRSHRAWPISAPTTVAVTPYGDYVLNGRLDWLILEGRTTDEFFLTRA